MLNRYDKFAAWYDDLARFVFGKDIVNCQVDLLPSTDAPMRVLILGGGTGWILEHVFLRMPKAHVTFVEASRAMIERAKRRLNNPSRVTFIHAAHDAPGATRNYEVVITNFFIDQFDLPGTLDLCQRVYSALSDNGLWLVSDFVDNSRRWHRFLLVVMYLFFRVLTGIKAKNLPPWEAVLNRHGGFILADEKRYRQGFIVAKKFRKTG
jgi:tRNA (cmo5U34)-methyltransferase